MALCEKGVGLSERQRKILVLTENPLGSEGLKLTFMEDRPDLHRAKVAQCMLGLCDVVSGKTSSEAYSAGCQ